MSKEAKLKVVVKMLQELAEDDFTGKIELNYTMGTIASTTKIEKIKIT